MNTRIVIVATALVGGAAAGASAWQHEAHQPTPGPAPVSVPVAQCAQAQPRVAAGLDAALKRLDDARQTNSPAVMRAAADDVQAALLDVRALLAPCAGMQAGGLDPHAAHAPAGNPPAPSRPADRRPLPDTAR